MAITKPANTRYFKIAELSRLRHVSFGPRRPVHGQYIGRHASYQRGQSVEFAEYRQYMPGDTPADIDWKVYGRSDRLYVKLFEHTTEMKVHLVIDGSESMAFAGAEPKRKTAVRKFDHACMMATAIAFLTINQQDQFSLTLAKQGVEYFARTSGSLNHLQAAAAYLENVKPAGQAGLASSLEKLGGRIGRTGLVVILSDLLDEPEPILSAMTRLGHMGHEIIVFHLLHEQELELPDLQAVELTEAESGRKLRVQMQDVRADYQKRLAAFMDQWATDCRSRGFDYQRVSTATHHCAALRHYLTNRQAIV